MKTGKDLLKVGPVVCPPTCPSRRNLYVKGIARQAPRVHLRTGSWSTKIPFATSFLAWLNDGLMRVKTAKI